MRPIQVLAITVLTFGLLLGRVATATAQQPAVGAAGQPGGGVATPPPRPFPPLAPDELAELQQVLAAWEAQSDDTKTLECKFQRWTWNPAMAPAGVIASTSTGYIQYAAPDKGLFKVEQKVFFNGMDAEGKPTFSAQPGQYGEWWVCNGEDIREFDRSKKECRIQALPPNLRGAEIFNSPLPFVFNLDAQQIQQRYWVRLSDKNASGEFLVEAWPKLQEDRAQYLLVQISLDQKTMMPTGLAVYAPNFDVATNFERAIYKFVDISRNSAGQRLQNFMNSFIAQNPPADWKVYRNNFVPPAPQDQRAATVPGSPGLR